METNPKVLWDNCLCLIKENVTEQQFRTWFAPIVFENYDEDSRTLLVQVPSMYVYEYLEQYYTAGLSSYRYLVCMCTSIWSSTMWHC